MLGVCCWIGDNYIVHPTAMKHYLWIAADDSAKAILHGDEATMRQCATALLAYPRAVPPDADIFILADGDEPSDCNVSPFTAQPEAAHV